MEQDENAKVQELDNHDHSKDDADNRQYFKRNGGSWFCQEHR